MMDFYALYNPFNLKGQARDVGVLEMGEIRIELIHKLKAMISVYGIFESFFYLKMLQFDHKNNRTLYVSLRSTPVPYSV